MANLASAMSLVEEAEREGTMVTLATRQSLCSFALRALQVGAAQLFPLQLRLVVTGVRLSRLDGRMLL